MALGEIGLFNPAESTYPTHKEYENALRGNAYKNAFYLSEMDKWYSQMDETIREFNKTLAFKETELAQVKALTEEQIGLSREQLELQNEQYKSDLALRTQALKEQTAYQTGMLAVENKKVNIAQGTNYLGSNNASDKAFDFLNKYLTTGNTSKTTPGGASLNMDNYSIPIYAGNTTPTSEQVNYGNIDESSWL